MKDKLSDLNDHLFAQLERLSDEDLSPEQIENEAKRAAAIVSIADQVSRNTDQRLKAAKLFVEHGNAVLPMLPEIGNGTK
jgi:hypothetical protein